MGIEVGSWGIGDVYCILLYMICFGDELGVLGNEMLVSWIGWCVEVLGMLGE